MPQLSDLVQKRKFVKKEYRPWDLSGTGTIDGKEIETSIETFETPIEKTANSIDNKLDLTDVQDKIATTSTTNTSETDNKTNNGKGNDLDNKKITNRKQPGINQITLVPHTGNVPVSNREQINNTIDNVIGNADALIYLIEAVKKLAGIQKNIFYYVINLCTARGALDTGNILTSDLASVSNCSIGSTKTSLVRLIEKQLILRLQGKPSRGGHMVLGITKEIQAAAIQAQQALFNPFKMSLIDNNTDNNLSNIRSYSSSNNKNIITTTSLPDTWKKINFESLQHIGFSEIQLYQLFDSKMTEPEIVQDSINKFAFALEYNEKVKNYSDPLNILMGVLRKGHKWNEPNYVSPKELALRQILDEKRKQKEQRDAMIKEYVELDFPDWRRKLTSEEIKQIVPAETLQTNLSPAITAALRTYFIEHILLPKFEE